jgi:hypothetical protein
MDIFTKGTIVFGCAWTWLVSGWLFYLAAHVLAANATQAAMTFILAILSLILGLLMGVIIIWDCRIGAGRSYAHVVAVEA